MSPRIRRVLKLVEALELDGQALSELRAELHARKNARRRDAETWILVRVSKGLAVPAMGGVVVHVKKAS